MLSRAVLVDGVSKPLASYCKRPFPAYAWTTEDYQALRAAAREIGAGPHELLKVVIYESEANPHAANCWPSNKYPNAIGLNQITGVNADAMGIDEVERLSLLDMSAAEQLPYVADSILAARHGRAFESPPDAATLYQTNIAPGTVGSEKVFGPGTNYDANAGLDLDGDGVITRTDLRRVMARVGNSERYKRMARELDETPEALGMIGWAAIAGVSYYAYRRGWLDPVVSAIARWLP